MKDKKKPKKPAADVKQKDMLTSDDSLLRVQFGTTENAYLAERSPHEEV